MKSTFVEILLVIFCVGGIIAQGEQNCKEVYATKEVQKFGVLASGTGCQYRVKSDSGQTVKVYVNATSGSKCVGVSSDGKSETLCPSGATQQFISNSAIDVSADSDTTSSDSTTAGTTPKPTAAPATTPKTDDGASGKDNSSKNSDAQNAGVQKPAVGTHTEGSQKAIPNEGGANTGAEEEDKKLSKQGNVEGTGKAIPAVELANNAAQLLRLARDTSKANGSNDVTVYYVLGLDDPNQSFVKSGTALTALPNGYRITTTDTVSSVVPVDTYQELA
ncbi:unnamed protein product [Echinostoma caproni]|uniref:Uncharacterized protein n=1 Tax=Echinostoma caproni TaxID=27848 RepID=A0A183A591_9TREM|nr:unnamed protein product [Echinostoma caproni]